MIDEFAWFERTFTFDAPVWMFPNIIERLRGTPLRLEALVTGLDSELATRQREDDEWSIQENVGHLWDLEALWLGRIDDIMNGADVMRDADLSNQLTYDRDHNTRDMVMLLRNFRIERANFVAQLDSFDENDAQREALHPRLQQPMRMIDLAYFVAEHDDHHLAQITRLKRQFNAR